MAKFSSLLSVMDRVPALAESLYLANSLILFSSVAIGHSIARIATVERGYLSRGDPAVYLTVSGRKVPAEFVQLLLIRGYSYYGNVEAKEFAPMLSTLRGAVEIRQHDFTGSMSYHSEFYENASSNKFTRAVIYYRAARKGLEVTIIRPASVPHEESRKPKASHASPLLLETRVTVLFSYPAVLTFGFGPLIEGLSHHSSLQLDVRGVSIERCFYFLNGCVIVSGVHGRTTRMRVLAVDLTRLPNVLLPVGMGEMPSDAVHVKGRYNKIRRFRKNASVVRLDECSLDCANLRRFHALDMSDLSLSYAFAEFPIPSDGLTCP